MFLKRLSREYFRRPVNSPKQPASDGEASSSAAENGPPRPQNRIWILVAAALCIGGASLLALRSDAAAQAGVRKGEPPKHFKSGGERSEELLAEILTTLQRIDERLARLEKLEKNGGGRQMDSTRSRSRRPR